MTLDLKQLTGNLKQHDNSLWFPISSVPKDISYTDDGHNACFAVEENSFWFQHRIQCILKVVQHFQPSGTLFDIGGGNGQIAYYLQQAGIESVLVEPGQQGAINAQKRGLEHIICATLEEAGFNAHSLPALGLFDVLEHNEDDLGLLNTLHRSLTPGGRLYLTVPAYQILWSQSDTEAGHFRRYTLGNLTARMKAAGFEPEYQTYLFSFLPLPILLLRSLPSLLRSRKPQTTKQTEQEHATSGNLARTLITPFLNMENWMIARQKSIPLGSSCLMVARSL